MAGLVTVLVGAEQVRGPDPKALEKAIDRAVDRGVAALKQLQTPNGRWEHGNEIGATALAGLTLLECGVRPEDKSIQLAADAVRQASITLRHTYSLALSILFLDRLGDPGDVRLIESMTLRLMGGQTPNGGWSYHCPETGSAEVQRLAEHLRQQNELRARRELSSEGRTVTREEVRAKDMPKRTIKDLPREIQEQLPLVNRAVAANDGANREDNSNTQFATLGLWVGRRYGLPVEEAIKRIDAHFRLSQHADGGWSYHSMPGDLRRGGGGGGNSTATMTAAGLLGLAVAYGSAVEMKDGKDKHDPAKDRQLQAALVALGTAIGHPVGKTGMPVPVAGGKSYYFLWSLERVAVALDLETIGKKNWYLWGAEVLVVNQRPDGTWQGEYPQGGVDTCFALLFLRRANLSRDLTSHFRGKLQDPGRVALRAGGIGGEGLKDVAVGLKPALEPGEKPGSPEPAVPAKGGKETVRPAARTPEEAAVQKLSDELVQARPEKRREVLEQLREGKGAKYTEALATAIPQLGGDDKRKAREALADRLARMKADTLSRYLQDELPEIRRAAALACAMKDEKEHVPGLIELLLDPEPFVARAAHAALKELTGQDFGPTLGADKEETQKAIAAWKAWWAKKK
jgi:hypothetical protein